MTAVIVGNRLGVLMSANVEKIPFENEGVLVRVPTDVVKDWNVGAEDKVEVSISREEEEISVSISKNGEEITNIPGATVEFPIQSSSGSGILLTDSQGNSYTGAVNETQNTIVIPIDKTGEYFVEEKTSDEENTEAVSEENEEESQEDTYTSSEEVYEGSAETVEDKGKDKNQKNLTKQHIKTTVCIVAIVVLLILLLLLSLGKGRRLRKEERGEGEHDR